MLLDQHRTFVRSDVDFALLTAVQKDLVFRSASQALTRKSDISGSAEVFVAKKGFKALGCIFGQRKSQ